VTVIKEFRAFLLQTNALALAVGVIIGGAVGKVVSSLVADILMPIISLAIPGGSWRDAKIILSQTTDAAGKEVVNAITIGSFIGSVVDFVIIATAVFMLTKALIRPAPAPAAAPTKTCPECLEIIPRDAKRCRACTSPV
jgi:large conductance mechanosensitive channel